MSNGSLLDTYELERQPIARINTKQSLNNSSRLPHLFKMAQSALAADEITAATALEIRAEIETHREHFLSTGLQLGFSYGPPVQGPADPTRYEPSVQPGARLPHAWIQHQGQRISTLDLLDLGHFTLLTGPQDMMWRTFAAQMKIIRLVVLDSTLRFESDWPAATILKGTGAVLVRPDGHVGVAVLDDSKGSQQRISETLEHSCRAPATTLTQ
jgi:hypothetical protein